MSKFPIIPEGDRLTEPEAVEALCGFLETQGYNEAKYPQIWLYLPGKWVKLKPKDRDIARTRNGEPHWHTVIRNIAAHQDKPGNPIFEGRLIKIDKGFKLAKRVKKTG